MGLHQDPECCLVEFLGRFVFTPNNKSYTLCVLSLHGGYWGSMMVLTEIASGLYKGSVRAL